MGLEPVANLSSDRPPAGSLRACAPGQSFHPLYGRLQAATFRMSNGIREDSAYPPVVLRLRVLTNQHHNRLPPFWAGLVILYPAKSPTTDDGRAVGQNDRHDATPV